MRTELRTSWERYNQEVEEENERYRQAIAAFRKREQKPGMFISGWKLLRFFGWTVLLAAGLILLCYGVAIAAAAWFGL